MDGTQARLKLIGCDTTSIMDESGKGGWDSGEIETDIAVSSTLLMAEVERVDGTQARLKQPLSKIIHIQMTLVERVDGTQARLKQTFPYGRYQAPPRWKGWMGLRRD